jgi:predicted ribosomally synthesized peptide with SipW-like signal peptide
MSSLGARASSDEAVNDGVRSPSGARRPSIRRRIAFVGLMLLVAAGLFSVGVNALFTDTASVGANDFTTGDLNLAATPVSTAITYTDMIPGDTVVDPLTVANTGSTDLRYSMESTTTENLLAAQLDLTVKVGVASCTEAGFGLTGTVLYGPDDLGSTTGDLILGDPATGDDFGDRTLTPAASETLCLQASLPVSSDNSFQSQSSVATFRLEAEQTAYNP